MSGISKARVAKMTTLLVRNFIGYGNTYSSRNVFTRWSGPSKFFLCVGADLDKVMLQLCYMGLQTSLQVHLYICVFYLFDIKSPYIEVVLQYQCNRFRTTFEA